MTYSRSARLNRFLSTEDMKRAAKQHGGRFLSPHYSYFPTKLEWQCAEGHVFRRTGADVRKGHWCTVCKPLIPKTRLTIELMRQLARRRGGTCLSPRYLPGEQNLEWRCAEGHVFSKPGRRVKAGSWCPLCTGPRTIEEVREIARAKGGECLSKTYRPSPARLAFRCGEGHRWRTQAWLVAWKGTWCPACGSNALRVEELQEIARTRGGECLGMTYRPGQKVQWRCRSGHTWRANASAVKGGTWCPRCGGSAPKTIADMRALARSRGGRCLSRTYRRAHEKLRWECAKGHTWEAAAYSVANGNRWCPRCSGRSTLSPGELREMAWLRGGAWVSGTYRKMRSFLGWRCHRGHEWSMTASAVHQGSWCPRCRTRDARTEVLALLARRRHGTCGTAAYTSMRVPLDWTCRRFHRFRLTGEQALRGEWCRECPVQRIEVRKLAGA